MSALALLPPTIALGIGVPTVFQGTGGTSPYTYKVLPNGAGGVINGSSGAYTAPSASGLDQVLVTDSVGATALSQVQVCTALELVCDILQTSLGLAAGRVYLWDQKIAAPTDSGLFIAVSLQSPKVFGNTREFNSDGSATQSVNFSADIVLDLISRGPDALYRQGEVIMALNSTYAQSQQELNSFRIFSIPKAFLNISQIDGAAIPYRFNATLGLQYFVTKTSSDPYFSTIQTPVLVKAEP